MQLLESRAENKAAYLNSEEKVQTRLEGGSGRFRPVLNSSEVGHSNRRRAS